MRANFSEPIPAVIRQHTEESANLRNMRSRLVNAPHVNVHQLRRLDDRLAAHLDGLAVAGDAGWTLCESALESAGVGEVFAATVRAVEDRKPNRLERLLGLGEAVPDTRRGFTSAFGWVAASFLQGTIRDLLVSRSTFRREVGLRACAMHRVDPGTALDAALADSEPRLRACGLRIAGVCGRTDRLRTCVDALADADPVCRSAAVWSTAVLGGRDKAVEALTQMVSHACPNRSNALRLLTVLVDPAHARRVLGVLARKPSDVRLVIEGAATAGDPYYVPWLISHMTNDETARLAGEALSLITGADLTPMDLERSVPASVQASPNDNPDDPNVDMDIDDDLPWPDAGRVQEWWAANSHRFQPGQRYFMGAPVTHDHCIEVLKNGYQRQRILAAHHLCLLNPGLPLFNTSAPSWRQQRLLAQM